MHSLVDMREQMTMDMQDCVVDLEIKTVNEQRAIEGKVIEIIKKTMVESPTFLPPLTT